MKQLYLRTKPVAMSEKWPTLWNFPRFQDTKAHLYNSFTAMDNVSDYVCFVTKQVDHPKRGTNYDIRKDHPFRGWYYTGFDDFQMISSTQKLVFYAMKSENKTGWSIVPYTYCYYYY